jgi:hypothetical protein
MLYIYGRHKPSWLGRLLCRVWWHDYPMTYFGKVIGPCRRCGHRMAEAQEGR